MKIWAKIAVLICFFLGNCVSAQSFRVVVLPVDLFNVCQNYYCFPEMSEIIAEDVIYNFNKQGKITSPSLYDVRKKASENTQLKSHTNSVLTRYKNTNTLDFTALRTIADAFDAKSVLLINSMVYQNSSRRSVWEVLEVSSAFEALSTYTLETNAVLTDNVNNIVMWSGKYKRSLGDNESRFWAVNSSLANSQLEKLRFYSRDIVSRNIFENVTLRFYPKVTKPVLPSSEVKTKETDFRPNPLGTSTKLQDDKDYGEIHSETIFDF